jgi:hypothetical protein
MHPPASARGSITLTALCFATVLAIGLSGYLALCQRSYQFSTRQMLADRARQLAETGLEEALWALNQGNWSSSGPGGNVAWAVAGASRTATISYGALGQGATGTVALTVANYAATGPAWPVITSAATVTLADGQVFTRTLQAATGPAPLFGNAIASAGSYVSFTRGGTVDSWNSDPDGDAATAAVAYSFAAGNSNNYAAVIAAADSGTQSVSLNQALVYGYLATAGKPVSYSTSGSPPGRVKGPTTPATVNIDSERLGKSAFIPAADVFEVVTPPTSGANFGGLLNTVLDLVDSLLNGPSTEDTYKTSGNLTILGIPLLSPNLTISRPIKLIVDGNLTLSGSGQITVTSTGLLQLFVSGDVTLGANGIRNQTNDPRKVALFCTSSSTSDSLQYTSSAPFCGVIYSENKPIDIRQNATFSGALLSGGYVRFSSSATNPVFHYDSALRHVRFSNVTTPYLITLLSAP